MTSTAASTLSDFIMVIDDALPTDFSKRLLVEYEECSFWKPGTIQDERSGSGVRNCHIVDMSHPDTVAGMPAREQLLVDTTELAKKCAAVYQDAIAPIGITGRSGVGLARYGVGGYYRSHHDGHGDGGRTVTMIAVVDSDFTGGELSFFRGDYVLDLQPGQICLFPSNFQYPHAVDPVTSGTRYSLISWLR